MEITKFCNYFSSSAQAESLEVNFGLYKANINDHIDQYKSKQGGLWVGGKFTISDDEFRFSTNTANLIVHKESSDFSFPMQVVKSVRREFGWITGILVFELEDRIVKVRCFGAKKIAQLLNNSYFNVKQ